MIPWGCQEGFAEAVGTGKAVAHAVLGNVAADLRDEQIHRAREAVDLERDVLSVQREDGMHHMTDFAVEADLPGASADACGKSECDGPAEEKARH